MFMVVNYLARVPFLGTVWQFAIARCAGLWNLVLRFLGLQARPSLEPKEEDTKPLKPPRHITYRPVPGSWQRREHPNWPESAFQIPENVPYGTIYYVTKGTQVGWGATAHVDQLPSGHIVKYPKSNPYSPDEEETHRRNMMIEAEIYRRIGACQYIPRLIHWDPESCCLTLEYLDKGDLATYMRENPQIPADIRQRWILQAAAAVKALHAVDVIHCDLTPRNFLLNSALDLHIADFAGSSVAGSAPTIVAGPRFQPPGWSWGRPVQKTDDIFALGSVMYFIMTGEEPFDDRPEEDVEKLFRDAVFPDVSQLASGAVILGCWNGTLVTAEDVIDDLHTLNLAPQEEADAS